MFLSDNFVHMRNEKTVVTVKGFNIGITHFCKINKSYNQYHLTNGRWIDTIGAEFSIVPRVLKARASHSVVLDKFDDIVNIAIYDDNIDTECNECPYTENCNGQMCFFSMI